MKAILNAKILLDDKIIEDKVLLFDHKIVKQLVGQHLSGKTDTSWMLWNLIVFQSWYENYFL